MKKRMEFEKIRRKAGDPEGILKSRDLQMIGVVAMSGGEIVLMLLGV